MIFFKSIFQVILTTFLALFSYQYRPSEREEAAKKAAEFEFYSLDSLISIHRRALRLARMHLVTKLVTEVELWRQSHPGALINIAVIREIFYQLIDHDDRGLAQYANEDLEAIEAAIIKAATKHLKTPDYGSFLIRGSYHETVQETLMSIINTYLKDGAVSDTTN